MNKVGAALAVTLIAGACVWLWLAPSGAVSCSSDAADGCRSRATLDLEPLDFPVASVERALALSPDGETVVVGLVSDRMSDDPTRGVVAAFDVATGNYLRTYVDQLNFSRVARIAIGESGQHLAVSFADNFTPGSTSIVQTFDFDSAELMADFETPCSFGLGVDSAAMVVQCETSRFNLADGSSASSSQHQVTAYSNVSFARSVSTQSGTRIDVGLDHLELSNQETDEAGQIDFVHHADWLQRPRHIDATGDATTIGLLSSREQPWWRPRPQQLTGALGVFDGASQTHRATFPIDHEPVGLAVSADGSSLAVVDQGYELYVFTLGS